MSPATTAAAIAAQAQDAQTASAPNTPLSLEGLDTMHAPVFRRLAKLYGELFRHDGFGEINLQMRFLRRGQKEVVIACGKEYRFVLDWPATVPVHADTGTAAEAVRPQARRARKHEDGA